MNLKLSAFGKTDVGLKRENNEDCFLIDLQLGLFVVCDGMGGHAAGEVAARSAAQAVAEYLREHHDELLDASREQTSVAPVAQLAEVAVEEASEEVRELGASSQARAGMGTTLSMVLVCGDSAVIAHVGDSRVYLKQNGVVRLLTTDHTIANELVCTGQMSAETAQQSRLANILTRSLGREETSDVDTRTLKLQPGDCLLLCSDGLSNYFEGEEEAVELLSDELLAMAPQRLIDFAKSRGGADNITAVVVGVERQS